MNWLEAAILGLLQGLTEFLPVSSSGHLELGKAILNIEAKEGLIFTIAVHGATVLSTIVVFRKDILELIKGLFRFKWNKETKYITMILISMIPVGIAGIFFKDFIKSLFDNKNTAMVGSMLIVTSLLLAFTYLSKSRKRNITFIDSFIIGISQALAVVPGISRSGSTIATGLLLGNKREMVAKFSFLMVLLPIIGENFLDILSGEMANEQHGIEITSLITGFVVAFASGLLACKWMIKIVNKGKLIYFSIYCFIIGSIAIIYGLTT